MDPDPEDLTDEDVIDITEAQRALADPASSIPLDEVLARYADDLVPLWQVTNSGP